MHMAFHLKLYYCEIGKEIENYEPHNRAYPASNPYGYPSLTGDEVYVIRWLKTTSIVDPSHKLLSTMEHCDMKLVPHDITKLKSRI